MDLLIMVVPLLVGIVAGYLLSVVLLKNKTVSRDAFEAQNRELIQTRSDLQHTREELSKLSQHFQSLQFQNKDTEAALQHARIENSNQAVTTNNLQQQLDNSKKLLEQKIQEHVQVTQELEDQKHTVAITTIKLNNTLAIQQELRNVQQENEKLIQQIQTRLNEVTVEANRLSVYNKSLEEKLTTQKQEIIQLQENAQLQFEKIARIIFEEKAARFTETNKQNIESLLAPLKEDINNFKTKVEETYDKESKQRFSLEEKVKDLIEQTNKVSSEANNLAAALKGQTKVQGYWGEMILERILETSGLTKDREYFTQQTIKNEEGKNLRPDVFVQLPDNRVIIIDSKVSLTAYERYHNATDTAEQKTQLNTHLISLYTHIDELSRKKYDDLDNALDFTMMFVPVEPAYLAGIQADPNLWNYAYSKRILLVSPTNLIACLKIISDVWKREKQSRNAREIVKRGELLYEKVVAFLGSMDELGRHLNKTQQVYHSAIDQLKNSRGNIVYQANQLQALGLKSSKNIPQSMLSGDMAGEDPEQS